MQWHHFWHNCSWMLFCSKLLSFKEFSCNLILSQLYLEATYVYDSQSWCCGSWHCQLRAYSNLYHICTWEPLLAFWVFLSTLKSKLTCSYEVPWTLEKNRWVSIKAAALKYAATVYDLSYIFQNPLLCNGLKEV